MISEKFYKIVVNRIVRNWQFFDLNLLHRSHSTYSLLKLNKKSCAPWLTGWLGSEAPAQGPGALSCLGKDETCELVGYSIHE